MDEDSKIGPKVSGYLEKKGKMKMMSSYKKYWFVLEGRLLLYYRSKDEYEAISPCKGSINLGPPCNVKPCSSTHGVFQIETRSNTITLRAENQEDQNRWMLGIMSALNQNKHSTKLEHFRYSLNELPQEQVLKGKLKHQNISPTDSPENQPNKEIIQRLQKIGAQTYGGSVGAINQIANSKKSETSNSNESLQYPTNLVNYRNSILLENDQYRVPNNNVFSETGDPRNGRMYFENVYERISRCSTESTNGSEDISYYTSNKNIEEQERNKLPNTQITNEKMFLKKLNQEAEIPNRPSTLLLENEVYDMPRTAIEPKNKTIRSKRGSLSEGITDRPSTFLLENEVYATSKNITTRKSKDATEKESCVILENRYCHTADNKMRFSNSSSESIYNEPKCTDLIDHNENNLVGVLRNGQHKANGEENAYSIIKLYDSCKNIVTTNSTSEYEDLDIYSEVKGQENEHASNEPPRKSKSILKKGKKKKVKENKGEDNGKEIKLKKTSSFIKRVWKRKPKHKETNEDVDDLYETVPAAVVEKIAMNDDTAIQMLSELHSILENKKPILSERLSADSNTSKHTDEKIQDKKVTSSGNINGSPTNNETAVQMLTELQNILENKKDILTARISADKDERKVGAGKSEKNFAENENHLNDFKGASSSSGSDFPRSAFLISEKMRPLLPPKNQKVNVDSPYHDFPKNNQPINIILPPKKKQNLSNIKSLDEILDDLEKEKSDHSNQNNVKKLIKQFSDIDFSEDDVVLRTNKKTDDYSRKDVDSEELGRLLEELAKVTCAPILTPGVTTSLINPNLTDEELLNLLPKHRRRHSEPDYDIPRPHKSLVNLPRKETPADSVIGSTRFFGPILTPSDINIKPNNTKNSSEDVSSMTPDSLEVEEQAICTHPSYLSEDEKNYSYTSHNYVKSKNCSCGIRNKESHTKYKNIPINIESSIKSFDIIKENDIYAQPKALHDIKMVEEKIKDTHNSLFFKSTKYIDIPFNEEKTSEVFVDSLETYNNETV